MKKHQKSPMSAADIDAFCYGLQERPKTSRSRGERARIAAVIQDQRDNIERFIAEKRKQDKDTAADNYARAVKAFEEAPPGYHYDLTRETLKTSWYTYSNRPEHSFTIHGTGTLARVGLGIISIGAIVLVLYTGYQFCKYGHNLLNKVMVESIEKEIGK